MGLTQQKKKIRRVTGSAFNKKRVNIDQKKKGYNTDKQNR